MDSFIITTDTTSDLPEQYLKEHHIDIIPLYYVLDGIHYGGEHNLTPEDFYNKMKMVLCLLQMLAILKM